MKALFQAAFDLQSFFLEREWRHAFIGGLALQRWGEPRLTTDVDVSLLTGFGGEEVFVDGLLSCYSGRRDDSRAFALKQRVLLLRTEDGIGIDVALAALPFEEGIIERATPFSFAEGLDVNTCSSEDLIVLKAFADRGQDWVDVEGILIRQEDALDWEYICEQLAPLCELKEAPEIMTRLKSLREKLSE